MTPSATKALLHMLGLDARHRDCWRNHYTTDMNGCPEMAELEAAGLVVERRAWGGRCWNATERGKSVGMAENRRINPDPPMSKRRYLHWLRISDVSDITFGEYLRRRLYDDPTWGRP